SWVNSLANFLMILTEGGFTLSFSIPETYPLCEPIFLATASSVSPLSFLNLFTRSPKLDTVASSSKMQTSTHHRFDTPFEVHEPQGLGQERVGAAAAHFARIDFAAVGGHRQDRHVPGFLVALEMAADLEPREVRQPDIQQDDVGLEHGKARGRVEGGGGHVHVVAIVEGVLEQLEQVQVVVHDEDAGADDAGIV